MGISREESIAKFGTEKYTAWDLPGATEDAKSKGMNIMQTQPNPAQLTGNQTVQANKANIPKIKGFTDIQNQYAQQLASPPDYMALYTDLAQQHGLTDINNLITGIDKSVNDIEDKIRAIEPAINKRSMDFQISESSRQGMVNAGEYPLRKQYSELISDRADLSAEQTAKTNLINTLMGYASTAYTQKNDYLKALMDIEKSNKTSSNVWKPEIGDPDKPTGDPTSGNKEIDAILEGVTIDDSGSIKSEVKNKPILDTKGNLKISDNLPLNSKQNKNKSLLYLSGQ